MSMIHKFSMDGYNIVLDVNGGGVHVLDDVAYDLVDLFEEKFVLCPKGWKGHRYTRYYCPNCKKPVKNDDSHCHNCGQNIKFPKIEVTNNKAYLDWSDEDE